MPSLGQYAPTIDRFWKYTQKGDGCWTWTGPKNTSGYGVLRLSGPAATYKGRTANRLSWEIHNGEIPPGMCVLHRCDNPACVNPAHLFLGTNADNIADKVAKDRQAKGEKHGKSKLTVAQVVELRPRLAGRTPSRVLAAEFGVSESCIDSVRSGRTWGHVK
jgi:hypothetical protein